MKEVPASNNDHLARKSSFSLFQWLPMFREALNHRRWVNAIALCLVALWAIVTWSTSLVRRPEIHFNADFVLGQTGNVLYRADRLGRGEVLYRDVASQYGFIPSYLYAAYAKVVGNTILTNRIWHMLWRSGCLILVYFVLRKACISVSIAFFCTIIVVSPLILRIDLPSSCGEYIPLETACFLILMICWLPPTQRTWKHAAIIGLTLGMWQGIKFGGAVYAGVALVATDLLLLTRGSLRELWLHWLTNLAITIAVFLFLEGCWVALAFLILPWEIALDALWPAYVLKSYQTGYQQRLWFLFWFGLRPFLRDQWVVIASLILGAIPTITLYIKHPFPRRRFENKPDLFYGLLIGWFFFLFGISTYMTHYGLYSQYSWTVALSGIGFLSQKKRLTQLAGVLLLAPSFFFLCKNVYYDNLVSQGNTYLEFTLPTSERIVLADNAARETLEKFAALCDSRRQDQDHSFNLFAMGDYAGGGYHYYYNYQYDLRSPVVFSSFFRSYDREELNRKYDSISVLIVSVQGTWEESLDALQSTLSTDQVNRLHNDFIVAHAFSSSLYYVGLRRGRGNASLADE